MPGLNLGSAVRKLLDRDRDPDPEATRWLEGTLTFAEMEKSTALVIAPLEGRILFRTNLCRITTAREEVPEEERFELPPWIALEFQARRVPNCTIRELAVSQSEALERVIHRRVEKNGSRMIKISSARKMGRFIHERIGAVITAYIHYGSDASREFVLRISYRE